MTWKKVEPEFFKFAKQGDQLIGILIGHDQVEINDKPVNRWYVELAEGKGEVAFLGGAIIDRLLTRIPEGTVVNVTYTGLISTSKKRQVKGYDVDIWIPDAKSD